MALSKYCNVLYNHITTGKNMNYISSRYLTQNTTQSNKTYWTQAQRVKAKIL